MLLGLLLGYELGKSSEKERLAIEKIKVEEEHLNALREQYMLGLLMPVRGQADFKVVVGESKNFDFRMVKDLLQRIGSPVKYFKYYTVGDTYVLEGILSELESMSLGRKLRGFLMYQPLVLWQFSSFQLSCSTIRYST